MMRTARNSDLCAPHQIDFSSPSVSARPTQFRVMGIQLIVVRFVDEAHIPMNARNDTRHW